MIQRRWYSVLVLLAFSVMSHAYTRLNPDVEHFVTFTGDLGYSTLLNTIPNQSASPGMGTDLGVGYRLYVNHFLFTPALEINYDLYANRMKDMDFQLSMLDTEGDPFQMHVMVNKYHDYCHVVNTNIPLLFGGEWGSFYFLVGPKFAFNVYGATSSRAAYTTFGEYDRYYDDFYDMPNHGFESNKVASSGMIRMNWNMNVYAHVEFGWRFTHRYHYTVFHLNPDNFRAYVALYAEYGFLNAHTSTSATGDTFSYKETSDGIQFFIKPLMASNLSNNATFNPLTVGVKFTIALQLHQSGKSHIYNWNTVGRDYRKRGGTQAVKYEK